MDTALALAGPYAAPALAFAGEPAETEDVVWWVVVVGFAYAVALAWATWCRHNGGSAEISFGWTGFKVVCRSPRREPRREGGRRRPPAARVGPARRRRASGSASAARPRSPASISASRGHRRRPRRPERIGQDDAAPRRRGPARRSTRARSASPGHPPARRPARQATALVPDEPTGFDELTVAELVSLVHALWKAGRARRRRAQVLIAAFGLDDRLDQRLGTLSRGLRRQASAVAAFSLAPPLILVDEATATLDPEAVVVLSEAVAALAARGCGVLLATQDLHFAGGTCHEVVLLHRGAVIDRGEPGALRARHAASSLEDVFLAALGDGRLRERVRDAFAAL